MKTFGRGWVTPLAVPSADRIVTVGLEAISMVLTAVVESRWAYESVAEKFVASFEVENLVREGTLNPKSWRIIYGLMLKADMRFITT